MPVKPIKPSEVDKAKNIPDAVFQAFNELIAKGWDGSESIVEQNDVVNRIMVLMHMTNAQEIYDNHWLDIEGHYEKAGWKVEYDKPGYNETYLPYFKFTA